MPVKHFHKFIFLFFAAGMFFIHSGCGFYSHTGASIPPDAKTVSVAYLPNLASIVSPTLSQILTEKLKRKFINETQLKMAQSEGDLQFSGKITDYRTAPVGVQGNQINAVNRLTITAEISFVNLKDERKSFTQTFTSFKEFPADQNFTSLESQLINDICDMMVTDIFNKAFINW